VNSLACPRTMGVLLVPSVRYSWNRSLLLGTSGSLLTLEGV
jgi:hypothetical protein